jgi:hypothetical protein
MTWYLHNTAQEFTEDMIGGAFGMVYLITHTPTGKKYVGKKFFTKAKTRQVKGKKKRSRVASDWITDMHYCLNHTIINGSVVRFVKTI